MAVQANATPQSGGEHREQKEIKRTENIGIRQTSPLAPTPPQARTTCLLQVESAGLVSSLARAPPAEVGEGAGGVGASVSLELFSGSKRLLAGGLGALAGDGVSNHVLVDDLDLHSSCSVNHKL